MTVGDILFSFGPLTLANLLVSEVENLGMSEGLFSAARYCQVPIASKRKVRASGIPYPSTPTDRTRAICTVNDVAQSFQSN